MKKRLLAELKEKLLDVFEKSIEKYSNENNFFIELGLPDYDYNFEELEVFCQEKAKVLLPEHEMRFEVRGLGHLNSMKILLIGFKKIQTINPILPTTY